MKMIVLITTQKLYRWNFDIDGTILSQSGKIAELYTFQNSVNSKCVIFSEIYTILLTEINYWYNRNRKRSYFTISNIDYLPY